MSAYTFGLPSYDPIDDQVTLDQLFARPSATEPQRLTHQPVIDEPDTRTVTLRMPSALVHRLDNLASKGATSRSHVLRGITSLVLDSIQDDPAFDDYEEQVALLYKQAHELINRAGSVSASLLQRHLRIDYHIALLLLNALEKNGAVTPQDANGHRMPMLQYMMEKAKQARAP